MWVFLGVAAVAAVGLLQTTRAQGRRRRYLEDNPEAPTLQLSHLSRALRALARDTRALRVGLEGPLRELGEGGGLLVLGESEELRRGLQDGAHELGEWVQAVGRLGRADSAYLGDVGADPRQVEALFIADDWGITRRRGAGQAGLHARLSELVDALERFEQQLQTPRSPYR